jgi:hypothetical protein
MTDIQVAPNEAQIMSRTREFVRGCIEDVFGQDATQAEIEHIARPIANLVSTVWRNEAVLRGILSPSDEGAQNE